MPTVILPQLQQFATTATAKLKAKTGEPEEQLRAPLETFFQDAGKAFGMKVQALGEVHVESMGRPDFAVTCNGALCGYIELKQPGKGGDPRKYRNKHDKAQWERFQNFPNILYTDGNEWSLFQGNIAEGRVRSLSGSVETDGAKAVVEGDAAKLEGLLREFLTWNPIVPKSASQLAEMLAPLCRLLRDEVKDAMQEKGSPFVQLAKEWRGTLFAGADDDTFADAYAQTVTFALLLARVEDTETKELEQAVRALAADHALLSKALQILTNALSPKEMPASLQLLQRVIAQVSPGGWKEKKDHDPWLYFYEHFLAKYDPALRKDAGVYYTPVEVVQAQVRLVDHLLVERLGKAEGFASDQVLTLDPAVGTGTYLLGIIHHVLGKVSKEQGPGAVAGVASTLARQLHGFEMLVGPYAVAQLRIERDLADNGATLPEGGSNVFLTDTLESPNITPDFPSLLHRELSQQHARALEIKSSRPVLICIGNPPYDRHQTATEANRKETGGWVRWGDEDENGQCLPERAILEAFVRPVRVAGDSIHLKNLYNFYVYFWRWALWKVFESGTAEGPGIVSFITASSYLEGIAFNGMRESMRRLCDEVWVLDLGGEGRGTRRDENVFNIQTPVAIAIAVRYGTVNPEVSANVKYCRLEGDREDKLRQLAGIQDFTNLTWADCPSAWAAPFTPTGHGAFHSWPQLIDVMPWQHSGVEFKRTWTIASDTKILGIRWRALLTAPDRAIAFKETRDRTVGEEVHALLSPTRLPAVAVLGQDASCPAIEPYGFRSFDRQYCIADNRVGDYFRPPLWAAFSNQQIYFASVFTQALSGGPAVTMTDAIPDRHYFNGRGGKDILPLFRDRACVHPNLCPGLLEMLTETFGVPVTPEDFAAYLYGILAHPGYTAQFHTELTDKQVRVPLTKSHALFRQVAELGRKLIWLHSYGERMVPEGQRAGRIPSGRARCLVAVPDSPAGYPETFSYNEATQTLSVGRGEFAPVPLSAWEFEVSGRKVLQSWLKYRMKAGAGKKSSPLDNIRPERWTASYTTDLLNLLWVLEATLEMYPAQKSAMDAVLEGPLFLAEELPEVPETARKAPGEAAGASASIQQATLFAG